MMTESLRSPDPDEMGIGVRASTAGGRRRGGSGRIAIATAIGLLTLAAPAVADAALVSGTAVRAIDGDTLRTRVGARTITVDLAGIAAPRAGECFATAARKRLGALAAGKPVSIDIGRAKLRTRTRVRGVAFPAGRGPAASFNLALTRAGLVEVTSTGGLKIAAALRRAEDAAVLAARGIFGPGCDLGTASPVSPGGGVTNPGAPQASAVTVPTSWTITAGTAATFPVPAGEAREPFYAAISTAFTELDRRIRGGRHLIFFEALGSPIFITNEVNLHLCSNGTFQRRFQGSAPPTIEDTTGTWRITIDLTKLDDPVFELNVNGGGLLQGPVALENRASRVLISGTSFLTEPSVVCT
jgi:endonuclease YncB( thermonuclease family)